MGRVASVLDTAGEDREATPSENSLRDIMG